MTNKLLSGHTSFDTALLVSDYPYGFRLRTDIKYWVESNKKGDRFVSCTLNPKTGKWNKPKASTYSPIIIMVQLESNGFIKHTSLSRSPTYEQVNTFKERIKDITLNAFQKDNLAQTEAFAKVMEHVTFECKPVEFRNKITGEIATSIVMDGNFSNWEKADGGKSDREQAAIQQQIGKHIAYEYGKLTQ